eukprot:scaffold1220_cov259-Pinguiococcus_pyrenoidosus.AAC.43
MLQDHIDNRSRPACEGMRAIPFPTSLIVLLVEEVAALVVVDHRRHDVLPEPPVQIARLLSMRPRSRGVALQRSDDEEVDVHPDGASPVRRIARRVPHALRRPWGDHKCSSSSNRAKVCPSSSESSSYSCSASGRAAAACAPAPPPCSGPATGPGSPCGAAALAAPARRPCRSSEGTGSAETPADRASIGRPGTFPPPSARGPGERARPPLEHAPSLSWASPAHSGASHVRAEVEDATLDRGQPAGPWRHGAEVVSLERGNGLVVHAAIQEPQIADGKVQCRSRRSHAAALPVL